MGLSRHFCCCSQAAVVLLSHDLRKEQPLFQPFLYHFWSRVLALGPIPPPPFPPPFLLLWVGDFENAFFSSGKNELALGPDTVNNHSSFSGARVLIPFLTCIPLLFFFCIFSGKRFFFTLLNAYEPVRHALNGFTASPHLSSLPLRSHLGLFFGINSGGDGDESWLRSKP